MVIVYKYYFNEETCTLYKSTDSAFVEEYIDDAIEWHLVGVDAIAGLEPISEEEADDIIKEFEGDEYDLVDGYVLCDFGGED